MLAIVLGLSPLQNIAASVSDCMNSVDTMHHQMSMSDSGMQHDMSQSGNKDDCCSENACDMSHCATPFTVAMIANNLSDITYTVTNIQLKPRLSLIQFYPSSLYRPPKA